jgi:hypothetical protein
MLFIASSPLVFFYARLSCIDYLCRPSLRCHKLEMMYLYYHHFLPIAKKKKKKLPVVHRIGVVTVGVITINFISSISLIYHE